MRWSVPGDLASIGPDGVITVHGRGSASINSGGEKIFPEEVEAAVKAHPDVYDAIVVGLPDERFGERVAAVVRLRDGAPDVTLDALMEHCRGHVAGYKVPRQLLLVDEIPLTAAGQARRQGGQGPLLTIGCRGCGGRAAPGGRVLDDPHRPVRPPRQYRGPSARRR